MQRADHAPPPAEVVTAKPPEPIAAPSRLVITPAPDAQLHRAVAYDGMYVLVSICSGSSLISTSKRSCTFFST